jgi:putative ABC transport system permease protein
MLPLYLAWKEIWHNKGRFLLIGLIVALITTLVLFIAALAEGLGNGNREYLQKLNGELLIFQENVDLSIAASRIGRSTYNAIRRVVGVADAGQVGFASAEILYGPERASLPISLIGVEPEAPGAPPVIAGQNLSRRRSEEMIVDRNVIERTSIQIGDTVTVRVVQGTKEELFDLPVVGVTEGRQYLVRPSVFVPYLAWDKIRPQDLGTGNQGELISNVVVVRLQDPAEIDTVARRIEREVRNVEAVDRKSAYEATPGYVEQQSTLDTQRYFTFIIAVLVIGGFFQIQTLQKVAQIGMLKAIGASNRTVAMAALAQIITVNAFGVMVGMLSALGLGQVLPPGLPAIFTGEAVLAAIGSLLLVGPLGGLVSIWLLQRVEPLIALGLSQ